MSLSSKHFFGLKAYQAQRGNSRTRSRCTRIGLERLEQRDVMSVVPFIPGVITPSGTVQVNPTTLVNHSPAIPVSFPLPSSISSPFRETRPVGAKTIGPLQGVAGQSGNLYVQLSNPDSHMRTVTLSPKVIPVGVSMSPVTVNLGPNATVNARLHFNVDKSAPLIQNKPLAVVYDVNDGTGHGQTGSTKATIVPATTRFSRDWSDYKIDFKSWVEISANGDWHWHADLHDNSLWYGDNYAAAISMKGSTGVFTVTKQGTLGAKFSGPAVNSTIDEKGHDIWIYDNYFDIVNNSVSFSSKVDADFVQLLKAVGDDAIQSGKYIYNIVSR
jgi:hypothetical protein